MFEVLALVLCRFLWDSNPSCRGVEDKHTGGWSGSDIAVIETKWVMDLF